MRRLCQPLSFFDKKFKPIGACSAYPNVSLFLPGHFTPATTFNEFTSHIREAYFLKFFEFLHMVRFLHKLGDADRCMTRQNCCFVHFEGRFGGCPATPCKAEDHCDNYPTNKTQTSKLKFPFSFWFH